MERRELLTHTLLLLGSVSSGTLSQAVLAGASAPLRTVRKVFDENQWRSINALAEMIIPSTDTPGAVEAGVPDFIATIVGEWYTRVERKIFFDGLMQLDQFCLQEAAQSFDQSLEAIRVKALKEQEKQATQYQVPSNNGFSQTVEDENAPFFKKIKELVVLGYYTSEVGATQELAYRPVPGQYNGNYEYEKVGRQWSH